MMLWGGARVEKPFTNKVMNKAVEKERALNRKEGKKREIWSKI